MVWLRELAGRSSATWHLALVSLRRLVLSRQSFICLLLLGLAAVAVFTWGQRRDRSPADFIEDILVTVYMSFLLPIFCLSFASPGVSTDREEQTLVYLVTTPLPRPFIFAAKALAALATALAWTMGSLALLCYLAGDSGAKAWNAVAMSVLYSTLAYAGLFQLFSVVFRRATIVALGYALFLETLVGNMPGIVKRLTIVFYARCLVFEASADLGVRATGPFDPILFQPLAAATAGLVLLLAAVGMFLAGLIIFSSREY